MKWINAMWAVVFPFLLQCEVYGMFPGREEADMKQAELNGLLVESGGVDILGTSLEMDLAAEFEASSTLNTSADILGISMEGNCIENEIDLSESSMSFQMDVLDGLSTKRLLRLGATSTPKKTSNQEPRETMVYSDMSDDEDKIHTLAEVTPIFHNISVTVKTNKLMKRAIDAVEKGVNVDCKHNCLHDHSLTKIQYCRQLLWNKNSQGRYEWLLDKLTESKLDVKLGRSFRDSFGSKLCVNCFKTVYFLNKNFYSKTYKDYKEGLIAAGPRCFRKISLYKEEAKYWLKDYFTSVGDRMPHKNLVFVPYGTVRQTLFDNYKREVECMGRKAVSKSLFMDIWKKEFPHVKIKKTNSFSKCDKCTSLERSLKETRDEGARESIKAQLNAHHQRQQDERSLYYSKRKQAEDKPQKYLSLITDGMDQSKTDVPHMLGRKAKCLDTACTLQTHVQGVINHGLGRMDKYIDIKQYPHDSNLVMHVLMDAIYETSVSMNNQLPPVLYIQADNCWRENKNIYMLGFAELLVRMDIFKEVHLSFLFVGHTHEDIDAGFSKIAQMLRKTDAETPNTLKYALGKNTKFTRGVFDIKNWLLPHLSKLSKHSLQHHYKFSKNYKDEIKAEYRKSTVNHWLDIPKPVLESLPSGTPDFLEPNLSKIDLKSIRKTVQNCKHMFSDFYMNKDEKVKEWMEVLTFLEQVKDSPESRRRYGQNYAKWWLTLLPKQGKSPHKECAPLDPVLQRQLDDEITETEVIQKCRRQDTPTVAKDTRVKTGKSKSTDDMKKKKERDSGNSRKQSNRKHFNDTFRMTEICVETSTKHKILNMLLEIIENLMILGLFLYICLLCMYGLVIFILAEYIHIYRLLAEAHCKSVASCSVGTLTEIVSGKTVIRNNFFKKSKITLRTKTLIILHGHCLSSCTSGERGLVNNR